MTIRQILFEAGPDGSALSNANSGSSTSSIGAGGTTLFSAQAKAHGNLGAMFTNAAGATSYRRFLCFRYPAGPLPSLKLHREALPYSDASPHPVSAFL